MRDESYFRVFYSDLFMSGRCSFTVIIWGWIYPALCTLNCLFQFAIMGTDINWSFHYSIQTPPASKVGLGALLAWGYVSSVSV